MFRLSVPDYQRKYEWGEREVWKLLGDVKRSLENGDRCYCLGAPVFMVNVRESAGQHPLLADVLDGQQRLATAVLIYGVASALLADLTPGREHHRVAELRQRFVFSSGRQTTIDHFLTLQQIGDEPARTQKSLFVEHVLPLFGVKGPRALARALRLDSPDQLCENLKSVYAWLASFIGAELSVLQPGEFQRDAPPMDHQLRELRDLPPVARLERLLDHFERVVMISPILLNMDMLETLRHRLFASLNSSGLALSDTDTFKNAVHLCSIAARPAHGAFAPSAHDISAWVRWTSRVSDAKFQRLLLAMRWSAEACYPDGDHSGARLPGPELLEYFLAKPPDAAAGTAASAGAGRRVFTWWDCEDQKEKCAYYYPRDFLAYVHDWKEASDYLDEARLGSPSAFNTLLLLACAGGVKKVGHQAESGTFAAGCDMLALALARWTYKSKSSPAAFAALLAKLERLVAALRLATGAQAAAAPAGACRCRAEEAGPGRAGPR